MFTKSLDVVKFLNNRLMVLGVRSPPLVITRLYSVSRVGRAESNLVYATRTREDILLLPVKWKLRAGFCFSCSVAHKSKQ